MDMSGRRFPLMPWSAGTDAPISLADTIARGSRDNLVSIARCFHTVGEILRKQIRWDQRDPYFSDSNLSALNRLAIDIEAEHQDLTPILRYLKDEAYIPMWKEALEILIRHQGSTSSCGLPEWRLAKVRAFDILEERNRAAENFDRLEFTHKTPEVEHLCSSIRTKIQLLERFTTVYNLQGSPLNGYTPPPEPYFDLYPLRGQEKDKAVAEAYPYRSQHKNGPWLVSAVFLTILACCVPLYLAWGDLAQTQGSSIDADFYLLILNSIMCVLGISTAVVPLLRRPLSSAYTRWAQVSSVLGVLAVVGSLVMYLYLPMSWSALLAFFAQACQSVVTLQLALGAEQERW
ncbi:hypothetical protein QBC47DRAFT_380094 [Echria macrotheca]|uniref:Uncharacterized protein n=1 Tax=Echria macrotheca TaxID=438768 RepID=A0AAJ0BIL3_9PEZI|nr:hypothetical protein QBC47DRAFT_380094 [Echria macrotheca]